MDKKLKVAVHKELDATLKATWPQFENLPVPNKEARALGWKNFKWHADERVWFFLTLCIDNSNAFNFRFMWNDSGEYPPTDVTYPFFQNDPSKIPGSCFVTAPNRFGDIGEKVWKVGSNPAFVPEVVVPAALAELKAIAEPIIQAMLERATNIAAIQKGLGDVKAGRTLSFDEFKQRAQQRLQSLDNQEP